MAAVTVDTDSIAASLNSIRVGCATEHGRSAVDAVSIALGHQFERSDTDGTFNRTAFLRDCGVQ
jgi:hypothetical protein